MPSYNYGDICYFTYIRISIKWKNYSNQKHWCRNAICTYQTEVFQQHSFVTKYPHKIASAQSVWYIDWIAWFFSVETCGMGSRYLLSVLTSLFLASRYSCISFALASSSCPASRNNCRVDEFSASNSSTSCFSLELKWHKYATFECLHSEESLFSNKHLWPLLLFFGWNGQDTLLWQAWIF